MTGHASAYCLYRLVDTEYERKLNNIHLPVCWLFIARYTTVMSGRKLQFCVSSFYSDDLQLHRNSVDRSQSHSRSIPRISRHLSSPGGAAHHALL